MVKEGEPRNPVKTTETSLQVLETVKRLDGATITEVASDLELVPSTAQRHLQTLAEHGWLIKDDRVYEVGLRPLEYGIFARRSLDFYEIARKEVDILAEETGEKARLTGIQNGLSILLYRQMGERPLNTSAQIGAHRPLHQLAAGKAILAQLSRGQVEEIIARHGLTARTDRTITSQDELFSELKEIRERGFGFNFGESIVGLNAVGAAIRNEEGEPIGALSLSGPANRLDGEYLENELSRRLLAATNEVEINLKYG